MSRGSFGTRLIARLDIKGSNLIKGVHLEGLRVVGEPNAFARKYYEEGIDELIFMDAVASLYGRNNLGTIIEHATRDIFAPITVGGGIRTVDDASAILRSGADKVALNSAAVSNPSLITEIARKFGSQCVVLSIEAKEISPGLWEPLIDGGRERTGLNVLEWVKVGADCGAGEILLTSIDREGTRKGFDVDLITMVSGTVDVPVIASGGMGELIHLSEATGAGADAVAMADIIHFGRKTVSEIRISAIEQGLDVRNVI